MVLVQKPDESGTNSRKGGTSEFKDHLLTEKREESDSSSKKEMTTKKFVVFLMKKFGMSKGKAMEEAFVHPNNRKIIMWLKKEIPEASFIAINDLLRHPDHAISQTSMLKEHSIPPSIRLVGVEPLNLKTNIKLSEKHKLPLVDRLEQMQFFMSKSSNVETNIETLKEKGLDPKQFVSALGASPSEFREFLDTPPEERTKLYHPIISRYKFLDDAMKKHFEYLITRLRPDEEKAFKEIEMNIEGNGGTTKNEMWEIFKKHVEHRHPGAALARLDVNVSYLVKDHGLERWEEMETLLNRPDLLHKYNGNSNRTLQ